MRRPVFAHSLSAASILVGWTAPAVAQIHDWTGFYVGASGGVITLDGKVPLTYPAGTTAPSTVFFNNNAPIFSGAGVTGTEIPFPGAGQLSNLGNIAAINFGYDLQRGLVVFGAEVDASYLSGTSASWTTGDVNDAVHGRTHSVTVTGGIDHLYGARARVGISLDRLLLFGTGGLGLGHANLSSTASLFDDNGYGDGIANWDGRVDAWRLGFIAGAGAEYALTDNLSVKLEGQYYNLGTVNVTATGTGTDNGTPQTVPSYTGQLNLSGTIIKGGINVRF